MSSPSINEIIGAEATETDDNNDSCPITSVISSNRLARQGAIQLCNALISRNHEAVIQIIESFKNEIDVNFIEPNHECPIASLAILSEEIEVAIRLFKLGANPLLVNREQRNSIYIACEYGYLNILQCVFAMNPALRQNINQPVTGEMQKYCALNVAARYFIVLLL
jgi:hypothetical protein